MAQTFRVTNGKQMDRTLWDDSYKHGKWHRLIGSKNKANSIKIHWYPLDNVKNIHNEEVGIF
jgi:hypothetical protein